MRGRMIRTQIILMSWLISCVSLTFSAQAALFELPVLDTSQTSPIFKTLSGAFAFRPVEPASDLGKKFGFYLGAAAAAADAHEVATIFQGFNLPYLPSADLQLGLGFPAGIVLEVGFLPTLSFSGSTFGKVSGALKWTLTRSLLPKMPFSIATEVAYTNSSINYSQNISGADITVTYSGSIISFHALVSKKLFIFEPYLAFGVVNQTSSLNTSGSTQLFGNTFPLGTSSASGTTFGIWPKAGLMIDLYLLGIGLEYGSIFGLTSFAAKASIRF